MVAAPQVIYTSSKSDALFLEKLRQGTGPSPEAHQFDVRLEKASAFNADGVSRQSRGLTGELHARLRLDSFSRCKALLSPAWYSLNIRRDHTSVATLASRACPPAARCPTSVRFPEIMLFEARVMHVMQARRVLETLHVRGMPSGLQPAERLHMLSTLVRPPERCAGSG